MEDVQTAIWSDPDFKRLSPNAKLVYLWSFTNAECNMAGLYRADADEIAYRTRLSEGAVEKALDELSEARFLYLVDGVLWVRARVKHLRSTHNDNMAKAISRAVEQVDAGHPLRRAFTEEYGGVQWLRPACESVFERTLVLADEIPHSRGDPEDPTKGLEGSSKTPKAKGRAKASSSPSRKTATSTAKELPDPDELPATLDERFHDVARSCHAVLQRIAVARGAAEPTLADVGKVIEGRLRKDHMDAAYGLERYLTTSPKASGKKVRDVVGYWRNWLGNEPDLAEGSGQAPQSPQSPAAANAQRLRERAAQRAEEIDGEAREVA